MLRGRKQEGDNGRCLFANVANSAAKSVKKCAGRAKSSGVFSCFLLPAPAGTAGKSYN